MSHTGECHICGKVTKLSFEHVPPRKAFNDRPAVLYNLFRALGHSWHHGGREFKKPRGMGKYTLCEPCNNNTGGWYAKYFVSWIHQVFNVIQRAGHPPILAYPYKIYPARVLKQVITMFCSTIGPTLRRRHPEIPRYLLNKEERSFPEELRTFAFLHTGSAARFSGYTGRLSLEPSGPRMFHYAEISFPPVGFVLTLGAPPPDERLFDITDFHRFRYDQIVECWMSLPSLEVHTAFPGDYRGEDEIKRTLLEHMLSNLKSHSENNPV